MPGNRDTVWSRARQRRSLIGTLMRMLVVLALAAGFLFGLVACGGGSTKTVTQTVTQQATSKSTTDTSTTDTTAAGGASATGITGPPAPTDAARLQGVYAMGQGTQSGIGVTISEGDATKWPLRSACPSTCTVSLNYPLLRNGNGGGFRPLTLHSSGPGRYTSETISGAADCGAGTGREKRTISIRVVAAEVIGGVPTATRIESYENVDAHCPDGNGDTQPRIHRFGNLHRTL